MAILLGFLHEKSDTDWLMSLDTISHMAWQGREYRLVEFVLVQVDPGQHPHHEDDDIFIRLLSQRPAVGLRNGKERIFVEHGAHLVGTSREERYG